MTDRAAAIAAHRFGLGPRPGELSQIAPDPAAWVRAQIDGPASLPAALIPFTGTPARLAAIGSARREGPQAAQKIAQKIASEETGAEILARYAVRATTAAPFRERMVAFWANHFSVSRFKAYVPALMTAFEREAIRPHIFGPFSALLRAAVLHPAMLLYLDNVSSVGPNSTIGRRAGRDLNENLAREVLELHTLGVDGGYTQADVEQLARALTGWGYRDMVAGRQAERARQALAGESIDAAPFAVFYPAMHEPGGKTLLGRDYRADGGREVLRMLDDLAQHPATARFIATKLCRHFLADAPDDADIAAVAETFTRTQGNLATTMRALIDRERSWAPTQAKVKAPDDVVVATLRAVGITAPRRPQVIVPLAQMGQAPFSANSPQGWPDTAAAWLSPASLMRRIEWAGAVAARTPTRLHPAALLDDALGPLASSSTSAAVAGAATREDAIALILSSPEFQRR